MKTLTKEEGLDYAAYKGWLDIIQKFIDGGGDIDFDTGQGSPLFWAIRGNQPEIVKLLLPATKNNLKYDGWAGPIEYALKVQKNNDMAVVLLENGAKPIEAKPNFKPLEYAIEQENVNLALQLVALTPIHDLTEVALALAASRTSVEGMDKVEKSILKMVSNIWTVPENRVIDLIYLRLFGKVIEKGPLKNDDKTVPNIIESRIFTDQKFPETSGVIEKLNTAYSHFSLKSLMRIMAVAAIGKHSFASENRYNNYLKILVLNEKTYNLLTGAKDTAGAYEPGMSYVLLRYRPLGVILPNIIHELTHFVMYELFKNKSYPYPQNDKTTSNLCNEMISATKKRISDLEDRASKDSKQQPQLKEYTFKTLKEVFEYKEEKFPSEIIARIPEILAFLGTERGILSLYQFPEVLGFYLKYILPAMDKYLEQHQGVLPEDKNSTSSEDIKDAIAKLDLLNLHKLNPFDDNHLKFWNQQVSSSGVKYRGYRIPHTIKNIMEDTCNILPQCTLKGLVETIDAARKKSSGSWGSLFGRSRSLAVNNIRSAITLIHKN